VTSPPYYGLRDYGTAQWEGGDEKCDHIEKFSKHGGERADRDQTSQIFQAKTICQKCGAIRQDQQIGLEETPELYVEKLVEIFREVRRIVMQGQ
jgi:site-specific DNA-methyltransferase (cytosine-N4-specific)